MWLTASVHAWTRGGSPTFSPGTDAGRVCPKALHDAEPTKHTQPFTTGKGFGNRDKEFALLYKKADFFYKLSRLSDKERWLILEKFPLFARFVLTFSRQYSKIKIVCIID